MKQKRSMALLVIMMLLIAILALGCATESKQGDNNGGGTKQTGDTIKVGVFEPLTGTNAAGGQMTLEGIKLANQLYPEVLGKKGQLGAYDN